MWFVEDLRNLGVRVKIREKLIEKRTRYQKIEVYQSELGKMLVLDGKIQLVERDEFHYHEMLVHVPMLSVERPENVLIIGGGDGGALREVLKHNPREVTLVEIDREVVETSKKYVGIDGGAFEDPRVKLVFMDGYGFVRETESTYDVILIDSYDPTELSSPLFSESFFRRCGEILDGCMSMQSLSPFLQLNEFIDVVSGLKKIFGHVKPYLAFTPSYPSGMWSFAFASREQIEPDAKTLKKRIQDRDITTRYYTPDIHTASFAMPGWIEKEIEKLIVH